MMARDPLGKLFTILMVACVFWPFWMLVHIFIDMYLAGR